MTKNLFMQRFCNETPYSWIGNVLWYEKCPCCNIIFSGLLCTHGTISVEILTVYDVITHLWRHHAFMTSLLWYWWPHMIELKLVWFNLPDPGSFSTAVYRVTIQGNVILVEVEHWQVASRWPLRFLFFTLTLQKDHFLNPKINFWRFQRDLRPKIDQSTNFHQNWSIFRIELL